VGPVSGDHRYRLPSCGRCSDPRFFPNGDDFRGLRVHQTRLEAGDASSDSYCYTS
jgi:selenium-binding protein 1